MSAVRVIRFAALMGLLAPGTAAAFDCGKAATVVEKAICGDPALKGLDDQMASIYDEVRAASTGRDKKALTDAQRKWLAAREDSCSGEEGAEKIAACVRDKTEERRRLLSGEAESGPGSGDRMIPVFIQQDGSKKQYDVDFSLIRFAEAKSAGEKLFNKEIDKLIKEAPLGPHGQDIDLEVPLSSYASATVAYASPRLISTAINSWSFDGGAHGNGGTSSINVELDKGRLLKIGDLLKENEFAALKDDCRKQIFAQKKEKNGEEFNPEGDPNYNEDEITKHLQAADTWTFHADKAVVTFNAYAIGAYAEGEFTCEFTMADLKARAKPGAPLP